MPLARILRQVTSEGNQKVTLIQECVLLREKNPPGKGGDEKGTGEKEAWVALDPETNNELIKGASTDFLRSEVLAGRLEIDAGWDIGS